MSKHSSPSCFALYSGVCILLHCRQRVTCLPMHPSQDHFYLPLGGMDVDISHMTDQDTRTPTPLSAPPTAPPAVPPTSVLTPTAAPTAGPLAGAPAAAAAQQPAAAMHPQVQSALPSPQYAAYSSSSSGPLGGREPREGGRGPVDLAGPGAGPDKLTGPGAGPDRLTEPGGAAAGPGVKTGTRLVVAAAPAGAESELGSGGSAQYGSRQDEGVREHKGRKHRHRAGGVNGVMGGGEGVTQAGGYVPGPLEAAGGGWQQDRSYEGYGARGY
jgi:hypothetical protein